MMDIINIVLTCVFLCVMNTGVIFIMDKIRKLTGDNIIHVIKMVLLVGAGAAVYIMTYYGINPWVIMELMIIIGNDVHTDMCKFSAGGIILWNRHI